MSRKPFAVVVCVVRVSLRLMRRFRPLAQSLLPCGAVDESGQELVESVAIGRRQRSQQSRHDLGGAGLRLLEPLLARRRDVDGVAAAVALVPASLGQALALQLVDDVDHRRLVELQPGDEFTLAHRPVLGDLAEHAEVAQFDAVLLQGAVDRGPGVPVGQVQLGADLHTEVFVGLLHDHHHSRIDR